MAEENVGDLIKVVVSTRKFSSRVVEQYHKNMSEIYIKHLQTYRYVSDKTENTEIVPPENPLENTKIDMEKNTGVDNLIKKMQEQIKLMDILVQRKQCPINQIIDKL